MTLHTALQYAHVHLLLYRNPAAFVYGGNRTITKFRDRSTDILGPPQGQLTPGHTTHTHQTIMSKQSCGTTLKGQGETSHVNPHGYCPRVVCRWDTVCNTHHMKQTAITHLPSATSSRQYNGWPLTEPVLGRHPNK